VKPKEQIQRLLKRVDRSMSGPLTVFSEQFLYGHREILMSYANLDDDQMLKGSIEHGWALDAGYGIPKFPRGRYLSVSWCRERMERAQIDHPQTVAMGAPFIYAVEQVKESLREFKESGLKRKRNIIFFPVHGNEFSQQNPDSQIKLFTEKYDPQFATVCLYWVEYVNPDVYSKYAQAGFEIVCTGFSGQMEHTGLGYSARKLAGSPIGGRPTFLLQTIKFLTTHDLVVMGGLGSVTFYAAYLRKKIDLLHGYFRTSFLDMDFRDGNTFDNNPCEIAHRNFVASHMGCDFENVDFNSQRFQNLAIQELGHNDMKSPEQMRQIFEGYLVNTANPQSSRVYKDGVDNFSKWLAGFASGQTPKTPNMY